MDASAIRVDGLSKRYRVGAARGGPGPRAPRRRGRGSDAQHVWALRDVSFEVAAGDVVGVVGRNGSGKSTLLKVLSRITEPTEGTAEIRGRVASLLEVGTGFHPELSGRENVYLNGAILGMRRAEISRDFDDIVAFSEIERFIDTPVKRYSSGMYVRLAFAVAAYLSSEILFVDEVLAVGDLSFQRKCLGRMREVAGQGRTVVFVSHNLAAVRRLCDWGLWLDEGRVRSRGETASVVADYMASVQESAAGARDTFPIFSDAHGVGLTDCVAEVAPRDGALDLRVVVDVESDRPARNIGVGLAITSMDGVRVSVLGPATTNFVIPEIDGKRRCELVSEGIEAHLAGGEYVVSVWLSKPRVEYIVRCEEAAVVRIPARDVYASGHPFEGRRTGVVPLVMGFRMVEGEA